MSIQPPLSYKNERQEEEKKEREDWNIEIISDKKYK